MPEEPSPEEADPEEPGPEEPGLEEASTDGPEPQPPSQAPSGGPTPPSAPLWRQWTTHVAVIVIAALAATAVIVVTQLASHPRGYAVPGNPCAMVSPATLAKYLPGGSVTGPDPGLPLPGVSKTSGCSWASGTGDVTVQVSVYGSATGPAGAEQGFDEFVQADRQTRALGPGSAASITGERPVARLGDQAKAIFKSVTPGPSSLVDLHIWSDNAEVEVSFSAFSKQASAAQLTAAVAVARNVLAFLASPAEASSPSPGPLYAAEFDLCQQITLATVAKYLPGAAVDNSQTPEDVGSCSWATPGGSRTLLADVTIYGFVTGAHGAEPAFDSFIKSKPGTRVTGLGDGAEAISELTGTPRVVLLIVWSGNAVIKITYTSYASLSGPPMPAPAAQLAATIAVARDILATLARA